ncbi:MAG TPA: hypothetical protein DD723_10290 [Candidatus Omnitrophica bacterium]|uniref:Uncharacterized protein n=1 Tax=Candidatus Kaiserbacteria bacterium GW2011_GWA2_49_19 TaxID=1618669 RepID=A0A0G1Y0D4_9BACT|nr:MAG: hypothetical protein UY44_C0011G0008 [Candidatus Kaiserbacteria bacterium GW2011_GWA2_49_19]HBR15906.1 hypothetical protein [Candidatus Omnitrophota bacterium]
MWGQIYIFRVDLSLGGEDNWPMRKVSVLLILLVVGPTWVRAQSVEEKRRIEEERRQDLLPGEVLSPEHQEMGVPESVFDKQIFFADLLSQEAILRSEAYQAFVILMGVENQYKETTAQFHFLLENGFLPQYLRVESDHYQPLSKGQAAYIFCKILEIKGGVVLRIWGVSQRYALKELVYEGIMSKGLVNDLMSGGDFIFTLKRAADYMAQRL